MDPGCDCLLMYTLKPQVVCCMLCVEGVYCVWEDVRVCVCVCVACDSCVVRVGMSSVVSFDSVHNTHSLPLF